MYSWFRFTIRTGLLVMVKVNDEQSTGMKSLGAFSALTAGVVSISECLSLKTGSNSKNKPHWISSPDLQTQDLTQMQELAGFKGRKGGRKPSTPQQCRQGQSPQWPHSRIHSSSHPFDFFEGNPSLNSLYFSSGRRSQCPRTDQGVDSRETQPSGLLEKAVKAHWC